MATQSLVPIWLEEYEDLMFGKNRTLETMSKAATLKLEQMPAVLYKYRACKDETLDALENDFLYSSVPSEFNDMFEGAIIIERTDAQQRLLQKCYDELRCKHPYLPNLKTNSFDDFLQNIATGFGHSHEEVSCDPFLLQMRKALKRIYEESGTHHIDQLEELSRNAYNICCFASNNTNDLMWAHYADNNRGFCIGYEIKALNNEMTHLTLPVIYKEENRIVIHDVDEVTSSTSMHLLSLKSTQWSYEGEWRTFFQKNPPSHKETMPVAHSVTLGAKIDRTNEEKIRRICNAKGISVFKIKADLKAGKLLIE